ncbi:hypothetical protein A3Q56_08305, partial [Intoshia linei]
IDETRQTLLLKYYIPRKLLLIKSDIINTLNILSKRTLQEIKNIEKELNQIEKKKEYSVYFSKKKSNILQFDLDLVKKTLLYNKKTPNNFVNITTLNPPKYKVKNLLNKNVNTKRRKSESFKITTKYCPDQFEQPLNSYKHLEYCYRFSTFTATWYEAIDYCRNLDSDLAIINSSRDETVLKRLNTKKETAWTAGFYSPVKRIWYWNSNNRISKATHNLKIYTSPYNLTSNRVDHSRLSSRLCLLLKDSTNVSISLAVGTCSSKHKFVCQSRKL